MSAMARPALVLLLGLLGPFGLAPAVHAAGPVGAVTADCSGVSGWAQDPDAPDTRIDVHLYFDGPAGHPNAVGVAVTANRRIEVGCSGEQCDHGFHRVLPLSRLDGQPRSVHAYGIDTNGDPNLELSGSPAVYTCPPLPIEAGAKRHIASPTVLEQWKFSTYFDMMKVADLDLAGVPIGPTIGEPPQLAVAEGTTAPLWLLDQGFRRYVSPEAAVAWRFDPAAASAMPAGSLEALPQSTPLPASPILVQGTGPEVWLLDEHLCGPDDPHPTCAEPEAPTTGEPEDPTTTAGSDPGEDTGSDPDSTGSGADTDAETDTAETPAESSTGAATGDGPGPATGSDAAGGEGGCGCRSAAPANPGLLLLLLLAPRRRSRRHAMRRP